jgi:hypothetical protein
MGASFLDADTLKNQVYFVLFALESSADALCSSTEMPKQQIKTAEQEYR